MFRLRMVSTFLRGQILVYLFHIQRTNYRLSDVVLTRPLMVRNNAAISRRFAIRSAEVRPCLKVFWLPRIAPDL